jgi:NAD-dependent DNA ligase
LYTVCPDAHRWPDVFAKEVVAGWSRESMDSLLETLPAAFGWMETHLGSSGVSAASASASGSSNAASSSYDTQYVVFSGIRDKHLQAQMGAKGWVMEDTITKKTNVLVIADDAETQAETTKMKKAKQMGITILTLSQFALQLNR